MQEDRKKIPAGLPWGGVQGNRFQYHPLGEPTPWYFDTIRHTLTCFHSEPRRDLLTPSSAQLLALGVFG